MSNIKLRTNAKNNFKKSLRKLMNNALYNKNRGKYDKTQENQPCNRSQKKKQFSARIKLLKQNGSPENLVAIEMSKTEVKVTKPVYLGFSIFCFSKVEMYEI